MQNNIYELNSTPTHPNGNTSVQLRIQRPDARPYIEALLQSDGRIPLAAERMHISVGDFILKIAEDPDAQATMERALRIYSTMKMFESLGEAKIVLAQNMHLLEPFEASKTFTNLAQLIEMATRNQDHTTNVNVFDMAMRQMPPEVKLALETLATANQQPQTAQVINAQIINHDDGDD